MTHRMLLDLPTHIDTDRLLIRPYQPGDGPTLYEVIQRNRDHLLRYESDNVLMEIDSEDNAEVIARLMAADWVSRSAFFLGLWEKSGGAWAGQVYIGPVD
jgi:RimJ/RimL family protein N-acetyltransferase